MKRKLIGTLLFLPLVLVFKFTLKAQEEYNGPFKSWANVKTRFGAKGDGKADDTNALQMALDSLSDRALSFNNGFRGYSVIYIPSGKYKITRTLVLRGKIGIKIVGESPINTTLYWQGNDNDTLFWSNGSAFYSMSRLTLDPGGKKNIEGIGLHWKSVWRTATNNSSASMNIEYSDLIFKVGFAIGISGGTQADGTNSNDSEITILRCIFNKCTEAGISIKGYNALDYWVWHCRFIQCSIGVSCNSGNYHIYSSYFKQSIRADIMNTNCYYSSVRYCYSSGSTLFSFDHGKSSNPFKRIFQANTIINPKQTPIQYFHTGKITLIDNYGIVPVNSTVKSFLNYDTWATTNYTVLDVGNVFENFKSPYLMPVKNYKIYRGGSRRRSVDSEQTFLNLLPLTPKYVQRTVYEIPKDATAAVIQPILNKASASKNRNIVHFAFGIYKLEKPLLIPKNSNIQIEGDGMIYSSALIPIKAGITYVNGSVFKIYGPSSVSIKDLDIQTLDGQGDQSRAMVYYAVDQPGSLCMIDQLYAGSDSSVLIRGYDHLLLQKTNSFFSSGNFVLGGKESLKGTSQLKMQCFGAQFARTNVMNNASFFASDCWWEGKTRIPLDFKGQGTILIQGGMIAPYGVDSNTTVSIGEFKGRVGLLDMYLQGGFTVKWNNPSLKLLVWNINFYHKKSPLSGLTNKDNFQAFFGGLTSQCFIQGDPTCNDVANINDLEIRTENTAQYLEEFIGLLRNSKPIVYSAKPAGISNVKISRISISNLFHSAIVLE